MRSVPPGQIQSCRQEEPRFGAVAVTDSLHVTEIDPGLRDRMRDQPTDRLASRIRGPSQDERLRTLLGVLGGLRSSTGYRFPTPLGLAVIAEAPIPGGREPTRAAGRDTHDQRALLRQLGP